MIFIDYVVTLSLSVVLIIGAYQFYFWSQRVIKDNSRTLSSKLDHGIPLKPKWIWIYSGLYYPIIVLTAFSVPTLRDFCYTAFSYLTLLVAQVCIFILFPVRTPESWRSFSSKTSPSLHLLRLVQKYDAPSNAFPSMHMSVATLTAFHLIRTYDLSPVFAFGFVALIAASCLFTKQHYIIDLPPGALLGWLDYRLFLILFAY